MTQMCIRNAKPIRDSCEVEYGLDCIQVTRILLSGEYIQRLQQHYVFRQVVKSLKGTSGLKTTRFRQTA